MNDDQLVESEQLRLEGKTVEIAEGAFAGETGVACLIGRDSSAENVVCLVYNEETDSNFNVKTSDCVVAEGAK